ncbi:arsenate reductase ArsC [bacterium]|nr:arsenate reductase ArsC [bacterium]
MKKRILILCTGNSARSQIAEGLFRAKASDRVEVQSAGTKPKGLNPLAVQVMNEIGIDISHHRSKDVAEFENEKFDLVLTVCDNAKESCPVFPGARTIHWSTQDPEDIDSFREVRDTFNKKIEHFLKEFFSRQRNR